MVPSLRRVLRNGVIAIAIVNLACSPADEADTDGGGSGPPFPVAAGIQQGVSLSALQRGGWSVCHEEAYAAEGALLDDVLGACQGSYMMLACRFETGDLLALAAADGRAVVTQADDATPAAHHVANGVGWYFTDSFSWGFFPAGGGVNRAPCDFDPDGTQTANDRRLCWHTVNGALTGGYRCGTNVNLNDSTTWKRLVLVHE